MRIFGGMKKSLLLWVALALAGRAEAVESPAEKSAVLQVVQKFFVAMQARDAAGIAAVFQPNTQFAVGAPGKDGYAAKQETIEELTAKVMKSPVGWLERMWNPTVLLDDRLAVVWARYDFHVGDKFTHNGTDCYTLLRTDTGWKIVGLAFTIEPGTKTENPAGSPRSGAAK